MKVSYSWLKELIGKDLPKPKELADLLTMHAFETDYLGKDVLEVDVLPNRAHDCLGHLGIAREVAAILKLPFKEKDYKLKEKGNIKDYLTVKVEDKDLCLRYTGRVVLDVQLGESPKYIQERLLNCGLRPINNIVDITNYVMLETGQPLHAFDLDKVAKKTIIVRRARKGEKITTLEKEKYVLDKDVLLITDAKKPLCIAGLKGGQEPEIDKKTKNIVLEAANFQATSIRKTSQKLKLRTDASYRFEHELDPNLTEEAIDRAAFLIQDIARGQVVKGMADIYPKKVSSKRVGLKKEQVNSLLGIDIPMKEIQGILTRLGFKVQKDKVVVPTRRIDVSLPEDLIEEVGRIYGYEKIINHFPSAALIPPVRNEELVYRDKVRNILSGLGFDEVYNYSFVGDKEVNLFKKKPALVELANPLSREQKYLRPNLVLNLIKNVNENKKYFEEIRMFEIGRVFSPEKTRLGAITSSSNGFYVLKGVLDSLLNKLRISDQWYDDDLKNGTPDFCHPTKRAEVKIGNDCLGWIGQIKDITAFELDFAKLVRLATEERIYLPPSKYPAMVRDIAVLVDGGTKVDEILNLINAAGGALIRDIDLFDIYENEGVKSVAFHIIYQSDDRNLTDKEVNRIQGKIIKTLEEEGGWEVRK